MKLVNIFRCICTVCFVIVSGIAQAQLGGGTIVPIGTTIPIDPLTDSVSIYLEKAVIFTEGNWFTRDESVAISANVNVRSIKRKSSESPMTFSRVMRFDVSNMNPGQIEIPLRTLAILDQFQLSGEDYRVTSLEMNLALGKKRGSTGFTRTLESLIEVSQNIPLPINPYTEGVAVFGKAFSSVVNAAMEESTETLPFAALGLRFLGGKGANFTDKAGYYAIVMAGDTKRPGVVALEALANRSLEYAPGEGLRFKGAPIKNNHFIVSVVATTDLWKAVSSNSVANVLKRIDSEGRAVIDKPGINAPNLTSIVQSQKVAKSATDIQYDTQKLESAVKELNEIRAKTTQAIKF